MKNADTNLYNTIDQLFSVIFGFIASIFAFCFMFQVDKLSVLFIIFPIIGNFFFRRLLNHIEFNRQKDMAPYNRRVDYINRVMYLKDSAKEIRLIKLIGILPQKVQEAVSALSPAVIANYSYDLAKEFNQYYHDTPILKEEDASVLKFRLQLIDTLSSVLRRAMDILGIELPERM